MKHFKVLLTVIMVFSLSMIVHAQANTPALAAVQNDNLVIVNGGSLITVPNATNKGILSLAWNPGATKLAYIINDDQYQSRIAVTDANASAPILLDTGRLEAGFPVSWTPDGQVLFIGAGDPSDMSKPYRIDIKRIAPEAGATAEIIGSFDMMVGCGGGSILPADWEYWAEAGFGGSAPILLWTDYGILHSTTCSGGGLALYAPQGGADTLLTDDNYLNPQPGTPQHQVARAVLAFDGKTIAAIRSTYAEPAPLYSLVLIDLSTLALTEVKTAEQPDQLVWLADGSLFYSSRTQKGNLAANLTPEQQKNVEAVFGGPDMEVPTYEVSIHHINVTTAEDKVVHTAPAYVVGRMAPTRDGQALVFSQIANMDKWVEGIANATLDVLNDNDGAAQRAAVPVTLYWLPLAGGQAVPLGDNLAQFQLKP